MQMNINDEVWVQLTEAGKKTYEKYYRDLKMEPSHLKQTSGDWAEFQMWELMNIFGAQCFHGSQIQFKGNILRFTPPKFQPVQKSICTLTVFM